MRLCRNVIKNSDLMDAVVSRRLVMLCVAPGAAPRAAPGAEDRGWFLDIRLKTDPNNKNSGEVISKGGRRLLLG